MLANAGAGNVYATRILSAVKLYYKKSLGFIPALIVMKTTPVIYLFIYFLALFCYFMKACDL